MADGNIRVPPDSTGKMVDAASLDVGANTVYRQRVVIGDNSGTATFAVVSAGSLQVSFANPPTINNISAVVAVSGGVAVSGTAVVAGVVGLTAGTAVIGDLNAISRTVQVAVGTPFTVNNISATVTVAGNVNISATPSVILAAGTANIGTLNNISAAVTVTGLVGLTAGTAVIGDLNAISRTVQVAIGTPFTVNNISATVTIAGVVNVSATASVILAAGAANIGTLNNISATVTVAGNVNISATAAVSAVIRTAGGTAVEDATNNALRVNVVAGSAGGPSIVDNSTFTAGQTNVAPIAALVDETAPGSASEGAAGILRMTQWRALHANLRLATGTAVDDTANVALRVNVVAGGGAGGGTSIADRGTFTPGTTAVTPAGGTFNSTAASLSDGEAAAVRLTPNRSMHINMRDSAGAEIGIGANPLFVNVGAISGTASVVIAAGAANIGIVNNISATVIVAGNVNISATPSVILAAGTANFGTLNNISATVSVVMSSTPSVILAAGTANFGTLNNISASVNVATGAVADFNTSADTTQNLPLMGFALAAAGGAVAGGISANPIAIVAMAGANNIGTINNISAAVTVTGGVAISGTASVVLSSTPSVILAAGTANIGLLNNISATVTVAGNVNISATAIVAGVVALTAGTANIGTLNGISATVTVAVRSQYANLSVPSASRGPRMILASTSSNVTLVAAPGAGFAIYVTHVAVSNASGSNTRARVGTSASIGQVTMMMAASGGGFVMPMNPPWKISTNEALVCSVKPNASEGIFNVHFFVASADAL